MLLVVNVMYELIFSIVNAKKSTLLGGKGTKLNAFVWSTRLGPLWKMSQNESIHAVSLCEWIQINWKLTYLSVNIYQQLCLKCFFRVDFSDMSRTFIHRLVHGAIFHGVLTTLIYTKTGWHEEKEEVLKKPWLWQTSHYWVFWGEWHSSAAHT